MTEIVIGVVEAVAPELSTARALTAYVPAATLVPANVYGAVVYVPITVEPFRKSTRTTVPSGSLAFAAKLIGAVVANTWPAEGADRLTVGGRLEVFVPPVQRTPLSVKSAGCGNGLGGD